MPSTWASGATARSMCCASGQRQYRGISPKLAVLMIGTNNAGSETSEQIAEGVKAIVDKLRATAEYTSAHSRYLPTWGEQ